MAARLKEMYASEVAPALQKKFGYKSVMQIPKFDKIVINVGCGEAKDNSKVVDAIMTDLATITGQKPVECKAKKSVANFKLREGMTIGVKVTLRGDRMFEFMDRLFNLALPRVRDFRGINGNSFDGRGNYAMGIKEQLIFPEIEYDKIDAVRGMDICFVTTAETDEEAVLRRCKSIRQADRNARAYGCAAGNGNACSDPCHAARPDPRRNGDGIFPLRQHENTRPFVLQGDPQAVYHH